MQGILNLFYAANDFVCAVTRGKITEVRGEKTAFYGINTLYILLEIQMTSKKRGFSLVLSFSVTGEVNIYSEYLLLPYL